MNEFIKHINTELNRQVKSYEKHNGKLEEIAKEILKDFKCKQIKPSLHTMNLSDVFIEPDLKCLINYEKEL